MNTHSLDKLLVVGDRVLIEPLSASDKTRSGLFLPPGYAEKENVQSGYVVKCGPGYPIPVAKEMDEEPWKQQNSNELQYLPLQAKVGDLAVFMPKGAVEVMVHRKKYFVVSHHAILLLEREDD